MESEKQKIFYCQGSVFERRDLYRLMKKTFTMKTTNNTKYIKEGKNVFMYSDQFFPKSKLFLFQKVKKEFHKNIKEKKIEIPVFEKQIMYFKFSENSETLKDGGTLFYNDVIELDISKAYYNTAHILGYISTEFYNECLQLPKFIRLALIGSIATNKICYEYVNGELYEGVTNQNDELLRKAWFHIVNYVDNCLFDFYRLCKNDFILFWVDAIIIKKYKHYEEDLFLIENKYNLKFTPKLLDWAEIKRKGDNHFFYIKELEKEKPKLFQRTSNVKYNPNI